MKNNFNSIYGEVKEKYQEHLDDVEFNVLSNIGSMRSVTGFFGSFLEHISGLLIMLLGGKSK